MDAIKVKFGAPQPITFRECDGKYMDLDLEARMAVSVDVGI